ncbi:hypothetical protein LTS15_009588 [Exophiala xenobiotica]|nr:hypothetical protein LTS15_009588 [Exophiala xenobiotica]
MYELPRTTFGGMQHITYLEENHNQLWDDTPMMTVLPLAKIGTLLHRPHYVDEAKRQFLLHIQYLYDAPTGLFFHGWQFDDENKDARSGGSLGHHFARARWARGNSWLTIAIPDFLELLDNTSGGGPDDGFKVYLVNVPRSAMPSSAQATNVRGHIENAARYVRGGRKLPGSFSDSRICVRAAQVDTKKIHLQEGVFRHCHKGRKAVLRRINQDGELVDVSSEQPWSTI